MVETPVYAYLLELGRRPPRTRRHRHASRPHRRSARGLRSRVRGRADAAAEGGRPSRGAARRAGLVTIRHRRGDQHAPALRPLRGERALRAACRSTSSARTTSGRSVTRRARTSCSIAPSSSYELLDGERELFDGVELLLTPGHAPAHQSLLVTLRSGGKVLLCARCDPLARERRSRQLRHPGRPGDGPGQRSAPPRAGRCARRDDDLRARPGADARSCATRPTATTELRSERQKPTVASMPLRKFSRWKCSSGPCARSLARAKPIRNALPDAQGASTSAAGTE